MKSTSQFYEFVARYYPAVYSLAAKLTDDPREALALTRGTFCKAQKQLAHLAPDSDRNSPVDGSVASRAGHSLSGVAPLDCIRPRPVQIRVGNP